MSKKLNTLFAGLVLASLICGCEAKPQNEVSTPTFKEVVSDLVKMRNTIRDGFAENNDKKAHGPLHDVGFLLEKLGVLASSADLSEEQKTSLKASTDILFEAFNQVDLTMHGKEGKTYDEVSAEIDAALKTITDMAGVENDAVAVPAGSESKDDLPEEAEVVESEAPPESDGE